MTAYGDRRRAGHYDMGTIKTTRQDTVHDPTTGGTTVQETPPEPDLSDITIAELREQAEALGLKTYGTKADLAERIANHSG